MKRRYLFLIAVVVLLVGIIFIACSDSGNGFEIDDFPLYPDTLELEECSGSSVPCTWTTVFEADKTVMLYGIWGFSANDIYVVGGGTTGNEPNGFPFVVHYDGQSWKELTTGFEQTLFDVWGSSPTNLYVAGGPSIGEILHFDGQNWERAYQDDWAHPFYKIWGANENNIYATAGEKLIYYNGDTWTRVEDFPEEVAHERIGTIWGYSESEVFATIGTASIEGPDWGHVIRFDGQTWSTMSDKLKEMYVNDNNSIWGDPNGKMYLAQSRIIFKYENNEWKPWVQMKVNFMSMWGFGEKNIFVGGDVGIMAHYNGIDWCRMKNIDDKWWIQDMWGEPGGNLFAVATKYNDCCGVVLRCVQNTVVQPLE